MSEDKETFKYLSRVKLSGYKSINDLEVNFKPGLNIIIGPNGSGKTNFLEYLFKSKKGYLEGALTFEIESDIVFEKGDKEFIHKLRSSNNIKGLSHNMVYNIETKLSYSINDEEKIEIQKEAEYTSKDLTGHFISNTLFINEYPPEYNCYFFRYNIQPSLNFLNEYKELYLKDKIFLGLPNDDDPKIARAIAGPHLWALSNDFQKMSPDAIKLALIKGCKDIMDEGLQEKIIEYTPVEEIRISEDIIIRKTLYEFKIENILFEFKIGNKWFKWNSLSDGTKRIVLLISDICYHKNGLFLIEEPELGIHPHQLIKLLEFIRNEAITKQIIITTHSPQVLDILEDDLDRLLIAKFHEDKTVINPLSKEQILKAQKFIKHDNFLGDYWRFTENLML